MNGIELLYSVVFAVFCVGIVFTVWRLLWRGLRRSCLRQDLLRAKDSLLALVIEERIAKDHFVFESLLDMANTFIDNTDTITLQTISRMALTEQEKLKNINFAKRFTTEVTEISKHDQATAEELKRLTVSMFCSVRDLILDSSQLLRVVRRLSRVYRYVKPVAAFVLRVVAETSIVVVQQEGYRAYRQYDQYVVSLGIAC